VRTLNLVLDIKLNQAKITRKGLGIHKDRLATRRVKLKRIWPEAILVGSPVASGRFIYSHEWPDHESAIPYYYLPNL
jgi:hypothetical protein